MNQTATLAVPQPKVLADVLTHTRVRDAALVLGAALLTAACAQISIPIPGSPVPVTGQTFAVLLTGAALGANRGALGQLLYVAMGLVGLPFYADGAHGVDVVWAPPAATSSPSRSPPGCAASSPRSATTARR